MEPAASPQHGTTQESDGKPSLLCPTEEYLHHNFTKVQLQKHCRSLGVTNVWATKDALVEMIMQATSDQSVADNTSNTSQNSTPNTSETSDEQQVTHNVEAENSDVNEIKELKNNVRTLNAAVQKLTTRMATLEAGVTRNDPPSSTSTVSQPSVTTAVKELSDRLTALETTLRNDTSTQPLPNQGHDYTRLEHRVTALEAAVGASGHTRINDLSDSRESHPTQVASKPPANTLLIGDSNLKNIRMSDLTRTCRVRTIREANIDLMRDWVKEQLQWTPDTCVIYGGMFDLLEGSDVNDIITHLSALICELKNRNDEMNVFVCQPVSFPHNESMQTKISDLNEQIKKWSEINEIAIINPDLHFKLGTGEVDESCFQVHYQKNYALLNRSGAVRLLKSIGKECDKFSVCVNWEKLQNIPRHDQQQQQQQQQEYPRYENEEGWQTAGRRRYRPPAPPGTAGAPQGRGQPRPTAPHSHRSYISHHASPPYHHGRPPPRHERHHHHHPAAESVGGPAGSYRPTHHDGRHHDAPDRGRDNRGARGCFNCGEFNHVQSQCRYDHRVHCTSCYTYGHKSRLCEYYNA